MYQAKSAISILESKVKLVCVSFFIFHFSIFIFRFSFFVFHYSFFVFHFSLFDFVIRFSHLFFHFSLFVFIFHFSFFVFHFSFFDIQNLAKSDIETEAKYSIFTFKILFSSMRAEHFLYFNNSRI